MDLTDNKFYKRVVSDFQISYTMFLLEHRLINSPAVRATFYAGLEKLIKEDPLPDPMMQTAILQHVRDIQAQVLEEYGDTIQLIFQSVILNSSSL